MVLSKEDNRIANSLLFLIFSILVYSSIADIGDMSITGMQTFGRSQITTTAIPTTPPDLQQSVLVSSSQEMIPNQCGVVKKDVNGNVVTKTNSLGVEVAVYVANSNLCAKGKNCVASANDDSFICMSAQIVGGGSTPPWSCNTNQDCRLTYGFLDQYDNPSGEDQHLDLSFQCVSNICQPIKLRDPYDFEEGDTICAQQVTPDWASFGPGGKILGTMFVPKEVGKPEGFCAQPIIGTPEDWYFAEFGFDEATGSVKRYITQSFLPKGKFVGDLINKVPKGKTLTEEEMDFYGRNYYAAYVTVYDGHSSPQAEGVESTQYSGIYDRNMHGGNAIHDDYKVGIGFGKKKFNLGAGAPAVPTFQDAEAVESSYQFRFPLGSALWTTEYIDGELSTPVNVIRNFDNAYIGSSNGDVIGYFSGYEIENGGKITLENIDIINSPGVGCCGGTPGPGVDPPSVDPPRAQFDSGIFGGGITGDAITGMVINEDFCTPPQYVCEDGVNALGRTAVEINNVHEVNFIGSDFDGDYSFGDSNSISVFGYDVALEASDIGTISSKDQSVAAHMVQNGFFFSNVDLINFGKFFVGIINRDTGLYLDFQGKPIPNAEEWQWTGTGTGVSYENVNKMNIKEIQVYDPGIGARFVESGKQRSDIETVTVKNFAMIGAEFENVGPDSKKYVDGSFIKNLFIDDDFSFANDGTSAMSIRNSNNLYAQYVNFEGSEVPLRVVDSQYISIGMFNKDEKGVAKIRNSGPQDKNANPMKQAVLIQGCSNVQVPTLDVVLQRIMSGDHGAVQSHDSSFVYLAGLIQGFFSSPASGLMISCDALNDIGISNVTGGGCSEIKQGAQTTAILCDFVNIDWVGKAAVHIKGETKATGDICAMEGIKIGGTTIPTSTIKNTFPNIESGIGYGVYVDHAYLKGFTLENVNIDSICETSGSPPNECLAVGVGLEDSVAGDGAWVPGTIRYNNILGDIAIRVLNMVDPTTIGAYGVSYFYPNYPSLYEWVFADNVLEVNDGGTGIDMQGAVGVRVYRNDIVKSSPTNGNPTTAIALKTGSSNVGSKNIVFGANNVYGNQPTATCNNLGDIWKRISLVGFDKFPDMGMNGKAFLDALSYMYDCMPGNSILGEGQALDGEINDVDGDCAGNPDGCSGYDDVTFGVKYQKDESYADVGDASTATDKGNWWEYWSVTHQTGTDVSYAAQCLDTQGGHDDCAIVQIAQGDGVGEFWHCNTFGGAFPYCDFPSWPGSNPVDGAWDLGSTTHDFDYLLVKSGSEYRGPIDVDPSDCYWVNGGQNSAPIDDLEVAMCQAGYSINGYDMNIHVLDGTASVDMRCCKDESLVPTVGGPYTYYNTPNAYGATPISSITDVADYIYSEQVYDYNLMDQTTDSVNNMMYLSCCGVGTGTGDINSPLCNELEAQGLTLVPVGVELQP